MQAAMLHTKGAMLHGGVICQCVVGRRALCRRGRASSDVRLQVCRMQGRLRSQFHRIQARLRLHFHGVQGRLRLQVRRMQVRLRALIRR